MGSTRKLLARLVFLTRAALPRPETAVAALLAGALVPVAMSAEAQAEDPKKKARKLFEEGTKAYDEGRYAEAVGLLEQAEEAFHAPTHLLYIARGKAQQKKLLDARAAYTKLTEEKLGVRSSPAFKEAQAKGKEELAALEERIPKLIVKVEPPDAEGLKVTKDGEPFTVPSGEFQLDPGTVSFEAKADALEAGKVIVNAAERTTTEVRLVLHLIGQKPTEQSGTRVVTRTENPDWPPMKVASLPLIGVGGGALIAGGVLGALHFVRAGEAEDKYASCPTCEAEVTSLDDEATLFGNLGIGLLAGGAATLGTGVLLFVLSPSGDEPADEKAPPTPQALLVVTPTSVELHGTF